MGDAQTEKPPAPPHPGSAWQQLFDPNTGYPYYWNVHNNQVRWDVPPEFVQYQQRQAQEKKAAEAAKKAENNGIAALVSAYSDDSDDEKGEEAVEEVKKDEDEELKPDFIGPVIPKPSIESEDEKEAQPAEEEPAPPGENDEDELTLLRKLQEKSAALAEMGGDISNEVKEIIDPEHLAKIEEDIADDIMSQIEAEEPPDYKPEEESNPKVPSPPIPEDQPPPDHPPPPQCPPLPPPGPPEEESLASSNPSFSLLSCSYGGESEDEGDDDEEEPKPKNHILPPKENLGNIFYRAEAGSGQTEEQKAALESFHVETAIQNLKNVKEKSKVEKIEVGRGRKRRLELPTGRFNKLEQGPEEKEQKVAEPPKFAAMPFVKSSSVLPGTINESSSETVSDSNQQVIGVIDRGSPVDTGEVAGEKITNGPAADSKDTDISNMAEELVDKLECFKVGQEKISSLKMLAVKIETLYGAWRAGALSPQYLTAVLTTVASSLTQAEASLNRPPWTALWDRNARRYNYRHILTGQVRESSPDPNSDEEEVDSEEEEATPPPLPPPSEEEASSTPPPPPPQSTTPPPPARQSTTPTADHQLQDMDIDEDENNQITEEMASFYSDLATLPPAEDPPAPPAVTPPPPIAACAGPVPAPAIIDHLPQLFQDDAGSGSSRSCSPVPIEKMASTKKKKLKKPKVSSSLALKKKGVGGMLEKWQNLQS